MNEKDLIYFCKLVEIGSYTETAIYFDVTQPTISTVIRRLAEHFNDPLIIQKHRKSKLLLTASGTMLYKKAKYLINEIEAVNFDVRHAKDKKIRLAFSGEAGSIYLPDLVKMFFDAGISDMLDSRLMRSSNAFEELESGEVDVAIYSWILPINDPNYYIRNLEKTEMVIITGLSDPWAVKKVVKANELRERNFIAREPGYLTRECLNEVGKLGNFNPNILFLANTMRIMIDLVERNVGIALVMKSSIRDTDRVHIIHLDDDQKYYAYMQIAMRKSFIPNDYQQPGIQIFRNFKA
ncbi:LysR family transcriptional regulator [Lactobacillus gigeriorum]|uniref:LysR substrate binding domain protein n=2 Tax=Lactobacillus gigeriorum DSM 23908 = CRBIP 24.85 TaxID=1423751 RepID=I7K0L6_9LACO|nr:LysR family transcriptional regulator [Lactobacillus gigeriorum]CCI86930.1 LysR substrate binding domain protein [Lactobacillus gigeriorum DSM 23908 = CRBIP 24.85]